MEAALGILLPRILPPEVAYLLIPHNGKSDLEISIPRKLKAWNVPGDRFVVLRDNDGADCFALKVALHQLCVGAGRGETLIRIVCQELEAWYLGDLTAVAAAYNNPSLEKLREKKAYRDPDQIQKPSHRLQTLVPEFAKIAGARAIVPLMTLELEANRSHSFQAFVTGVQRLAASI